MEGFRDELHVLDDCEGWGTSPHRILDHRSLCVSVGILTIQQGFDESGVVSTLGGPRLLLTSTRGPLRSRWTAQLFFEKFNFTSENKIVF